MHEVVSTVTLSLKNIPAKQYHNTKSANVDETIRDMTKFRWTNKEIVCRYPIDKMITIFLPSRRHMCICMDNFFCIHHFNKEPP